MRSRNTEWVQGSGVQGSVDPALATSDAFDERRRRLPESIEIPRNRSASATRSGGAPEIGEDPGGWFGGAFGLTISLRLDPPGRPGTAVEPGECSRGVDPIVPIRRRSAIGSSAPVRSTDILDARRSLVETMESTFPRFLVKPYPR